MEEKQLKPGDSNEEDEFFGNDTEQDGIPGQGNTMAARELTALTERLNALGYQDGIEEGVEQFVQEGFDNGYATGATSGWDIGLLYGGAVGISAALGQTRNQRAREEGQGVSPGNSDAALPAADGAKDCADMYDNRKLDGLVEDLKRASLSGLDSPQPNKEETLHRLRLVGSAGAIVANRLSSE